MAGSFVGWGLPHQNRPEGRWGYKLSLTFLKGSLSYEG